MAQYAQKTAMAQRYELLSMGAPTYWMKQRGSELAEVLARGQAGHQEHADPRKKESESVCDSVDHMSAET